MAKQTEQQRAAKAFADRWAGHGYEKGESQTFWLSLLHDVYGVEQPADFITFETQTKGQIFTELQGKTTKTITNFIDAFIPSTHVMIEQKSLDKDLLRPIRQSDGSMLSPFQQAKRYAAELPYSQRPRWIIACNFAEFHIYDMEKPNGDPEIVRLKDLERDYYRLNFLVDTGDAHIQKETEVSLQAGELVGILYHALLKQYQNPEEDETLKNLNILCVRMVFCLYAEDAGLFGKHAMFHDYLNRYRDNPGAFREALIHLFRILDQKPENRDPYLDHTLAAFPYVNGGLFADHNVIIPRMNTEIIEVLLRQASEGFDWSQISPTIFGAAFESTLNPETRRSGGMHYTSIENIHKVIDPLFLDDLREELEKIKGTKTLKTRQLKLLQYQEKLASLEFLDPAAGSGNFLTETYLSLRRLENEVIRLLHGDQIVMGGGGDEWKPIQVSISQFHGIEINDFAVTVAKTALWIAESQMMKETEAIVNSNMEFLPLKTNANIVEGNALRLDWEEVVPGDRLDYIMGNPPFVGGMLMSKDQKREIRELFSGVKGAGEIDYVSGWYLKSAQYMKHNSHVTSALVSTNSIAQGEQPGILWKHLMGSYNIDILFAHKTFRWDSEASLKAHVHCVIIGLRNQLDVNRRISHMLFEGAAWKKVKHINPYLSEAPDVFIENRSKPLCTVPPMRFGNMPRDGGGLILSEEEKEDLVKREPITIPWIHLYLGSREFLNNKRRYCLWLDGVSPAELHKSPSVMRRVKQVRDTRLESLAASTKKMAETPTLFAQITQEVGRPFIIVPRVSSEKRQYIPMGFQPADVIASDAVLIISDATLFHFGVLTSNVHMAWMRTVAGRLEMRYRYSKDIVYNNFPWPGVTPKKRSLPAEQLIPDAARARIEKTAQAILDARARYPEDSLADLYDPLTMPVELRKAHQANDKAVMDAYGFDWRNMTETECVAALMKRYRSLTRASR